MIVLVQVSLSTRLKNTAYTDEALYIVAGRDYLDYWAHGDPFGSYGDYFSGVPVVYPVFAAAVDGVGGLEAVRGTSVVLIVASTLAIRATARHLWGPRCGDLTALTFALVGPVIFIGRLATFDAGCVAALSAALWLAVTRESWGSAVLVGVLLAAAGVLKYAGVAFLPVVLLVMTACSRRQLTRPALAGAVATVTLGVLYLLFGSDLRAGIVYSTAGRTAHYPYSSQQMLHLLLADLGLVIGLALVGAAILARPQLERRFSRRAGAAAWDAKSAEPNASHLPAPQPVKPRSHLASSPFRWPWLLPSALLAGAVLLPAGQFYVGEGASFEKHLGYSAVFLAPLAGRALLALSRVHLGFVLVAVCFWFLAGAGLSRSSALYEWPDVTRVVQMVEADPIPGHYLSTAFQELSYYTWDQKQVQWDSHYAFFQEGTTAMAMAVADRRFQFVALRVGESGDVGEDAQVAFMITALNESSEYRLVTQPFPVRPYSTHVWRVYRLAPG